MRSEASNCNGEIRKLEQPQDASGDEREYSESTDKETSDSPRTAENSEKMSNTPSDMTHVSGPRSSTDSEDTKRVRQAAQTVKTNFG